MGWGCMLVQKERKHRIVLSCLTRWFVICFLLNGYFVVCMLFYFLPPFARSYCRQCVESDTGRYNNKIFTFTHKFHLYLWLDCGELLLLLKESDDRKAVVNVYF